MAGDDETPWYRLDKCCCCIPLKTGVLIIAVFEMIFSVIAVVSIIFYMIVGGVGASSLPIVGASSLIGELVAILMSCLSFGCALYAFIDIQRAETWGLRVYYIFKIISLAVSILVFIFISHNFSDVGSLIFSSLISAYVIWCIWSLHEALMLGGKAAEDVGFSKDQAGENSPLFEKKDSK